MDRENSDLDYANAKQTLYLSCLGCQYGRNDLSPEDRKKFLSPLLESLSNDAYLGDAAAEYLDLKLRDEEGKATTLARTRLKQLGSELEASEVWSEALAKKEWDSRLERVVDAQTRRTHREGKPGKEVESSAKKYLDRHEWAPGGTHEEHMGKAKTFVLASGGLCPVFGVPGQALRKADGTSQTVLQLSIDRRVPSSLSSLGNR